MRLLLRFPRNLLVKLIIFYQRTISPDHGIFSGHFPYGYCRHYPSCSEYAKQSIARFGVVRGGVKAIFRVIRCNPWTEPSVDLIND